MFRAVRLSLARGQAEIEPLFLANDSCLQAFSDYAAKAARSPAMNSLFDDDKRKAAPCESSESLRSWSGEFSNAPPSSYAELLLSLVDTSLRGAPLIAGGTNDVNRN